MPASTRSCLRNKISLEFINKMVEEKEPQFPRSGFSSSEAVKSINGGTSSPPFLSVTAAGNSPAQPSPSLSFASHNFFVTFSSMSSIDSSISRHPSPSEPDPADSVLDVPVVVLSSKVVAKVLKKKIVQICMTDEKQLRNEPVADAAVALRASFVVVGAIRFAYGGA